MKRGNRIDLVGGLGMGWDRNKLNQAKIRRNGERIIGEKSGMGALVGQCGNLVEWKLPKILSVILVKTPNSGGYRA